MMMLPIPPQPKLVSERPTTEAELIRARVASHARWDNRRRWLSLRAAVFGRAKGASRRPAEPALRPAQA